MIVISADQSDAFMDRAYSLGATDYIHRPFHTLVVRRRIENTLMLYAKQRRLTSLVSQQVLDKEKLSSMLLGIFGSVVEAHNGENNQHILRVRTITEALLHQLAKETPRYRLTEEEIIRIGMASALHDIGKSRVPEAILKKPGPLTAEERAIMETHTTVGAAIIKDLPAWQDDPLVKTAYDICRWHHERWDGGGYPDGLLGEQIPISAQVVALADVFDALTSDRCYKKAYTHDTAITIILNGQCGAFNPMLLDCLQEISMRLRSALPTLAADQVLRRDAKRLSAELLQKSAVPHSDRAQRELNYVKEKLDFFVSCCGDVQFEYDVPAGTVIIADRSRPRQQQCTILDVHETDSLRLLRPADIARLRAALKATTPENNELSLSLLLPVGRKQHWHNLRMHTLWSPFSPGHYVGVIGCLTDVQKVQGSCAPFRCTGKSVTDEPSIANDMQRLSAVFDVVRLVDPTKYTVLDLDADGILHRTGERCAAFWDNDTGCANCISARAFAEHTTLNKLEFTRNEMYFVIAKYITINGTPCVLELISRLNEGRWIDANGSRFLLDRTRGEDMQLFLDPLTNVYSRRYFETYRTHLEGMEGVALIDVNNFKLINDRCGHAAGDAALRDIANAVRSCIRKTDILIRYGGDEFLLLFYGYETREALRADIRKLEENFAQSSAALPDGKGLCIRMSGGVAWYPEDALDLDTLKKYADFAMYEVKHSTKGEIREFDMERYRAGVYAMEQRSDFEKLIRERRVDYDFQPIVSAHDGHVVAYEALMRPQLPTLRSPLTVMQLASEMGRMYDIEKLTLFRACECYEELKAAGKLDADALIFVNSIASVSLSDEDWASYCEAHSATLPKLVVEITEEEEMNERELERKRDFLGSPGAFALDDYGSGYSNGNSLLTVAPKYVKVDIAIIRGIDTDADKQQFLKTLIDYARPRGIYVLAEGVETLSELRKVLEMGVDLLQGYCLACPAAEPVAIDEKAVQVIREAAQKRIEQEEAWS